MPQESTQGNQQGSRLPALVEERPVLAGLLARPNPARCWTYRCTHVCMHTHTSAHGNSSSWGIAWQEVPPALQKLGAEGRMIRSGRPRPPPPPYSLLTAAGPQPWSLRHDWEAPASQAGGGHTRRGQTLQGGELWICPPAEKASCHFTVDQQTNKYNIKCYQEKKQ